MGQYSSLSRQELEFVRDEALREYEAAKAKGLKLDMSRGKPESGQLDLSMDMLGTVLCASGTRLDDGTDLRNYGMMDGIPAIKKIFSPMLGAPESQIIIGGNASLSLMYDTVSRAMTHGFGEGAWIKLPKVKFLCPVPGYDRHFAITEFFGVEMINVKMNQDGPDMDEVERLAASDDSIKGMWCVPVYSNPQGVTYSADVVRRLAAMKAAKDFRIMWDNAYCVHHLDFNDMQSVPSIIEECEKAGNPDRAIVFASTSKVTFAGGGVAAMASSPSNIALFKKQMSIQTIGYDKINQQRHVRFLGSYEGLLEHMKKHAQMLAPKFETVLSYLEEQLGGTGIASWTKPKGGYFISLEVLDGCAKRVVELCKDAGVIMTPAGATYPYGLDPQDSNIRIAPTVPPVEELREAVQLLCICVRLAAAQKLLG